MAVFENKDYRSIIKAYLHSLPKKGYGELARMAEHLNVNSTLISQIMSGNRDLTNEQAADLAHYMGLAELESEYFLLLVQLEKAGSERLRSLLRKKIENLQKESKKVERRYEFDRKLTEEQRSIFYSSWVYSAIRLYTSVGDSGRSLNDICEQFDMDRDRVIEILTFLEKSGLCSQDDGKYKMAVQNTFLEQGSPHLIKHHSNWRIKALQNADSLSAEELMFTSAVSLSKADFSLLKEDILKLLKKVSRVVKESPAEDIACLNIDFFWILR